MLIAISEIIDLKLMKVSPIPTLTLEIKIAALLLVSPLFWFSPFFQKRYVKTILT